MGKKLWSSRILWLIWRKFAHTLQWTWSNATINMCIRTETHTKQPVQSPQIFAPGVFCLVFSRINWANAQVWGQMSLQPVGIITNLFPFVCVDPLKPQHTPALYGGFLGRNKSSHQIANAQRCRSPRGEQFPDCRYQWGKFWDFSVTLPITTLCAQWPPGPPDVLLVWPWTVSCSLAELWA